MKRELSLFGAALVATISMASQAFATDIYTLTIQTGMAISGSCTTASGKNLVSKIDLAIDDNGSSDISKLSNAIARVSVCSPFMDPVQQTIPLPLPVALMKKFDTVKVGQAAVYPIKPGSFGDAFKQLGTAEPNTVIATKINAGVLELRLMDKKALVIGPIRAFIGESKSLNKVDGYKQGIHIALSRVEYDNMNPKITLKGTTTKIKQK